MDENLNKDGTIKLDRIEKLESEIGQKIDRKEDYNTKSRRSSPTIKSKYEDSEFSPAYSVQQLQKKVLINIHRNY